jgi:hypothetical protein
LSASTAARACCEQRFVVRQRLLGGVGKIRQQRKEQVGVAVAEIADLHRFEQVVDVLRLAQQGGDDHHGAVAVRYSLGKIHARQGARRQDERDQQVHQRDGQRGGGDERAAAPEATAARFCTSYPPSADSTNGDDCQVP